MSPNVTKKSVSGNVWCGSCQTIQPVQLHSYRHHDNLMIVSGTCSVCDGPVCKISTVKSASVSNVDSDSPTIQVSTEQRSLVPLLGICLALSMILLAQSSGIWYPWARCFNSNSCRSSFWTPPVLKNNLYRFCAPLSDAWAPVQQELNSAHLSNTTEHIHQLTEWI